MQHIKRINANTFHATIGERVLEAVCPYNTETVSKLAIQGFLVGNTKFICRVTDITELLRIEAESTLITASRQLGCAGTERYSDGALHLRHPFGLIRAGWSRRDHNWTISTDQDIYVCDPDAVSVRKALVFLLDDVVNKDDTSIPLGLYFAAGLSITLAVIVGYILGIATEHFIL